MKKIGLKGRVWGGVAIAAPLAASLFAAPAQASLVAGSTSISFGAYTVSVADCSSALCANADITALSNNLGFVITHTGGGALLDTSNSLADFSVTFEVTTTSPILTQVILGVSGSATGAGVAMVTENAQDPFSSGIGSGAAFAGGSSTLIGLTDPGDGYSPPFNDIFLTKDISADSSSGGTATIDSVTQQFAVPEPSSLAVLGMGLFGMLVPRRRRR